MIHPNAAPKQGPSKFANVVRVGRKVAGKGMRAGAPTPFLHLHPANAKAVENVGLGKIPVGPRVQYESPY